MIGATGVAAQWTPIRAATLPFSLGNKTKLKYSVPSTCKSLRSDSAFQIFHVSAPLTTYYSQSPCTPTNNLFVCTDKKC